MCHGSCPFLEEALGAQAIGLAPKLKESLLERPGLGGLQLASQELLKSKGPVAFDECALQPEELGVLERLSSLFPKDSGVRPSGLY